MTADLAGVPGQLDLIDLLHQETALDHERALFTASGLVFDTDACRDGHHHRCTGTVHTRTGDVLHSTVSPLSGPCRCTCH